jgi:hypothetical protein
VVAVVDIIKAALVHLVLVAETVDKVVLEFMEEEVRGRRQLTGLMVFLLVMPQVELAELLVQELMETGELLEVHRLALLEMGIMVHQV